MNTTTIAPTLKSLTDLLLARGLVTQEAVDRGEEATREGSVRLPAALTRLGLLSERELAEAIGALSQLPVLNRSDLSCVRSLPSGLNANFLRAKRVLPISCTDTEVSLAMADPLDDATVKAMSFALGRPIRILVAEESDIEDALTTITSNDSDSQRSKVTHLGPAQVATDLAFLDDRDSDAPIIRLVSRLIAKAVALHASDIHIEPQSDSLVVRFRVDGNLSEQETLSRRHAAPVASRIKLMAKLDIAETRLPQDGRIKTSVRGNAVDLRIATFPSINGESVVLRILGQQDVELDIERIGLSLEALSKLRASLAQPHGLVLITGPTGSGKTTTLYAALNSLRSPKSKIVTVEDPIEFSLPGISQLQVKPEIGLTFSAALRSVLRNDPEIILIGEIRDKETADIAIRAALTGHLVLATLHTNTAAGAITRLLDLGVEDYLLASVLLLTSAQRLVRRVCDRCGEWSPLSAQEGDYLDGRMPKEGARRIRQVRKPRGCAACGERGFKGRIPVFEAIPITDSLRSKIQADFDELAFELQAAAEGTQMLFEDGLQHVAIGDTTLDELLSAVGN